MLCGEFRFQVNMEIGPILHPVLGIMWMERALTSGEKTAMGTNPAQQAAYRSVRGTPVRTGLHGVMHVWLCGMTGYTCQ